MSSYELLGLAKNLLEVHEDIAGMPTFETSHSDLQIAFVTAF